MIPQDGKVFGFGGRASTVEGNKVTDNTFYVDAKTIRANLDPGSVSVGETWSPIGPDGKAYAVSFFVDPRVDDCAFRVGRGCSHDYVFRPRFGMKTPPKRRLVTIFFREPVTRAEADAVLTKLGGERSDLVGDWLQTPNAMQGTAGTVRGWWDVPPLHVAAFLSDETYVPAFAPKPHAPPEPIVIFDFDSAMAASRGLTKAQYEAEKVARATAKVAADNAYKVSMAAGLAPR